MAPTAGAEFNYRKIGVGLNAGISIANVDKYPGGNDNMRRYQIGAAVEYPLNSLFDIQAEFLFVGKGFEGPDTTIFNDNNELIAIAPWSVVATYFEIPLTLKFKIPAGPKYIPYLIAGGFWATPLSKKQRISSETIDIDLDISDIRIFDWGLAFGAGIDLKAGRGWLNFDIRYDLSTQSLIKNRDNYSRVWLFRIGYSRDLGSF